MELRSSRSKPAIGEIISRAERRNPQRVGVRVLQGLTKYLVRHLENQTVHLAEELGDFHSARVNPREIAVPPIFYETLGNLAAFAEMPLFRHYCVLANYTTEKTRAASSGSSGAATSTFLDTKSLDIVANKPEALRLIEALLKEARETYLPILERALSPSQARIELFTYANLLVRCFFAKPFPADLGGKVGTLTGKLTREKAKDIGIFFASRIDERLPELDFSKETGLQSASDNKEAGEEPGVNLANLGGDSGPLSGPQDGLGLKTGDLVKVTRRFSVKVPLKDQPDFRRDITEGTEGEIKGFADEEHIHLLLAIDMTLPNKKEPREVIVKALPKNLALKQDQEDNEARPAAKKKGKAGASGAKEDASGKPEPLVPKGFQFLNEGIEDEEKTKVIVEKQWPKLLDHDSTLQRSSYLKARTLVGLQTLAESLPEFGTSDLMVCHRTRAKGQPLSEVWTLRDFAARELLFAPITTELKEGLWTKTHSVMLAVPQQGAGKHPDGKNIGLDGRGRSLMSSEETIDEQEHSGNLFWVIRRSSEKPESNMSLEQASWSLDVSIKLPGGAKKRKAEASWPSDDLPSLPLMVNLKPIKKHTELVLHQTIEKPSKEKKAH